ncbi:response regulator [Aestuariivita boseongensis]|uniref:response regulator n=1 Tax=Aestuariivita boseongensis TaxID=1470562 RepID=UPI000682DC11|nr:response regulator [Aestuariivita boseongensis]
MANQTVLVVDDDLKIRTLIRNVLEDEGFAIREAETAQDVFQSLSDSRIDLITLDIHLGKDNGVDLAREIRRNSQVPIIMVSGKDDVIDRVVGLEVGADDYIAKPFHVRELVARVRSVLRRSASEDQKANPATAEPISVPAENQVFEFDGMTAIPDHMELINRNREDCGLTSGDFRLLMVFLDRPKRVLSRDQLMDLTGGVEWSPLDRTIDNQVARLRKKIERDPSNPRLIKTVRGVGYTLACDVVRRHSSTTSANNV